MGDFQPGDVFATLSMFATSISIAFTIRNSTDRVYFIAITAFAWLLFGILTSTIDMQFPYADGGDDRDYHQAILDYAFRSNSFPTFIEFQSSHEQIGYPWLLAVLHFCFGGSLFSLKMLNVFFLVSLGVIWYSIGQHLGNRRFARASALAVYLMTPMWFYSFFLLKDMSIVVIESLTLLAACKIWERPRILRFLILVTLLLMILPFRSALALQNILFIALAFFLRSISQGAWSFLSLRSISVFFTLSLGFFLASNSQFSSLLGINSSSRVIGTFEFSEAMSLYIESRNVSLVFFPLYYIVIEIAGFSPDSWIEINPTKIRSLLAIPWIMIGVPFLIAGVWSFFSLRVSKSVRKSNPYGIDFIYSGASRFQSAWTLVVTFVIVSVLVAFTVGDTTRWRLADMPMIAVIALLGAVTCTNDTKLKILTLWPALVIMSFATIALMREI